jgi:hypothetical protein
VRLASFVPAILLGFAFAIAPGLAAAAPVPQGCTFAAGAYACAQEETEDCASFTALGAGAGGLAGASVAGIDACSQEYVLVSASAGPMFVNAGWLAGEHGCYLWASSSAVPGLVTADCPSGQGPPNPGWGHVLP